MLTNKLTYTILVIISAVIICFEIIATRISSVIFVSNYAFMILSFAILGLGLGGVFSHYMINYRNDFKAVILIGRLILFIGLSLIIFVSTIILLNISNPFVYFFILIIPFFLAGIVYSQIYKLHSESSFFIYASDLIGAAIGSIGSIFILDYLGASNGIMFLSLPIFALTLIIIHDKVTKAKLMITLSVLGIIALILLVRGDGKFMGSIPIGNYPEKDYYHVYPNAEKISRIEESRWSVYGRTDLVEYTNQDFVKQIFIDGSAGSQMYRFNGDIYNPGRLLSNLLVNHSTSIPFIFLTEKEKNSMLVIGPGGGKEILIGLLNGINKITGVEVNPDFVSIVEKYRLFNGGIYTDFPNVNIEVSEGRHFIKQSEQKYDIICMALPSTEQLQSIDNLASNENHLLTVEAIIDYLNLLTPEGQLIFTLHNRWELIRLIVTAIYAFEEKGISAQDALNHFIVIGEEYAPSIIIKKNSFKRSEIAHVDNMISRIPKEFPQVSYLPFRWDKLSDLRENTLLKMIHSNITSIEEFIEKDQYDISPVWDDSPYFYKVNRGVPSDYQKLLGGILFIGLLFISFPIRKIKSSRINLSKKSILLKSLMIFIFIGLGFMILEISLFQKFILYLGSPTLSLSILLGSLLIGMGFGSYFSEKIIISNLLLKIKHASLLILLIGLIFNFVADPVLEKLLLFSITVNSILCFLILLPFGLLLGIPFPSTIKLLRENNLEKYIPWMYGINGIMSVTASILTVVLSMLIGYTITFLIGLAFYAFVFLVTQFMEKNKTK